MRKRNFVQQFKIVNVVVTAALEQPIDLELLREHFPKNILYDQDIYGDRVAYFKTESRVSRITKNTAKTAKTIRSTQAGGQ
ncbi:MAG: hypothetical protein QXK89_10085 [Candidatus Bathyarchaeia archaeon]